MIDKTTREALYVSTDGTAGPYIMVPVVQLDSVRALLKSHGIPHWADESAISIDGEPEIAVINLGRGANTKEIQAILDSVP